MIGDPARRKAVIGLVGGMGSGKSRIAEAFLKHRALLISGDPLGHEALEQIDIRESVVKRWGSLVLDERKSIDRKKLGAIVFKSAVERANLEHLVLPWIEKRIAEEIEKSQRDETISFIVLDAAIMLETGWNAICDHIVYIHAPRAMRLERLSAQRGWTADDVAQRETAQLPLAVKAARADAAIDNSGGIEESQRQVDALVEKWGLNRSR